MTTNTSGSNGSSDGPTCLPLQDHISLLRAYPGGLNIPYNHILLPVITANAVLATVAALVNALVIRTIARTKALQTPPNLLVLGLAVADFGVSAISQPSFCIMKFAEYKKNEQLLCSSGYAFTISFWVFSTVSFATLSLITADRFLAIQLHLRYQQVITTRRYGLILILVWVVCMAVGPTSRIFGQGLVGLLICFSLLASLLLINGFFLFKIFKTTHKHSVQIQVQQSSFAGTEYTPNDCRLFKRSLYTMHFIIGAFALCYFPYVISMVALMILKKYHRVAVLFTVSESLVMLNGLFNPVIYFWRIENLRTEAIKTLTQNRT